MSLHEMPHGRRQSENYDTTRTTRRDPVRRPQLSSDSNRPSDHEGGDSYRPAGTVVSDLRFAGRSVVSSTTVRQTDDRVPEEPDTGDRDDTESKRYRSGPCQTLSEMGQRSEEREYHCYGMQSRLGRRESGGSASCSTGSTSELALRASRESGQSSATASGGRSFRLERTSASPDSDE